MADRSLARVLAPLALIAAVAGVIVVVVASQPRSSPPPAPAIPAAAHHRRHATRQPRAYVVKPGDSLSAIAVKTGVSVAALQRLNPAADPQALQTGQRLKLAP